MAKFIWEPGTTYDDWSIRPKKAKKNVNMETIDLRSSLTRYNSKEKKELPPSELPQDVFIINAPILSAPMQAVTNSKTAVALAKQGGLGVIFCSQFIKDEARMVADVKSSKAGFVAPVTLSPEDYIQTAMDTANEKGYSTFPVTHNGKPKGILVGLLTKNDFSEMHKGLKIKDRMIPLENIISARSEDIDDDLTKANYILEESHHGSIPIIDKHGKLKYMIFKKDIEAHRQYPFELVDNHKRYKVGAAINTKDYRQRVPAIIDAGADIIFIDSAQGYSDYQEDTLRYMARKFPKIPVIGGNIATADGFDFLVANGAWAVKVGMGPGSICTSREKFGIGAAQATAVIEVSKRRNEYLQEKGIFIPVIADGGIVTNEHFAKALFMGADATMAGRFFARFEESPTKRGELKETYQDRIYTAPVKPYWGEGSERARAWRKKRYGQSDETEGIEGWVPYVGHMNDDDNLPRTIRHIKYMMQRLGSPNISYSHHNDNTEFRLETKSSREEGSPHHIFMDKMWAPYKAAT
jgi:IMP dehydrogenase